MAESFVDTISGQTMGLNVSKAFWGTKNLAGLCTDLFLIIIRMREAEDLGEPSALRKLIVYYIDLFEKNCHAISIPDDSILEAKYAFIALIDEAVLCIPGKCRDFWISQPLQLELFGDNIAGQEFYNKLQKLLLQTEIKKDVLNVYYLCLSLGFEGMYRMGNEKDRLNIIEDLGNRLRPTRPRNSSGISPHGRTAASTASAHANFYMPFYLAAAILASCCLITGVILYLINNSDVSAMVRIMLNLVSRS